AGLISLIVAGFVGNFLRLYWIKSSGLKRAANLIQRGNPNQALDIYHTLHERFPRDATVLDTLVRTIIQNGSFVERSIAPLWEVHKQRTDSDVLSALASCYSNKLDTNPELLSLYQSAEQLQPDSPMLKYLIGKIYKDQGDARLAQEKFRAAIKLETPSDEPYIELADLLLNARQANARNLSIFRHAYEATPDDAGFLRG